MVDCRNCANFVTKTNACIADEHAIIEDELIGDCMSCGPYKEIKSKWKRVPCVYM